MPDDKDIVDDLISGSLKRSKSYYADYADKTCKGIVELASGNPTDKKARSMRKLIEQAERLRAKGKGRRS